ncbi:MAG TPA: methyltransferase domain-containing protein [Candidatus Limnocylindria bacterium]|nr:methyltransferase domain-containing protein [Candidatus Limnocylindria bacterium]
MAGSVDRTGCGSAYRPDGAWELRQLGAPERFRGVRLLDVGTGDGRLALAAAPLARRVVGIDPDRAAIAVARASARDNGWRHVSFRRGAAQRLVARGERFDVVLFSWSL